MALKAFAQNGYRTRWFGVSDIFYLSLKRCQLIRKKETSMNNVSDLKIKFGYILSSKKLDNCQMDICEVLAKKGLQMNRQDCQIALDLHNISSIQAYNRQLIEITLFYIKISLIDTVISEEEMTNIRFLKLLFSIQEGDFNKDSDISNQVAIILKNQIDIMLKDDGKIDLDEALQKVLLQEIFGLSYDEFSVLTNQAAMKLVEQGSLWSEVDVFVSKNEVNEWHIKNYGRGTSTPEAPDESDSRTRHITQEVKDDVWNRDNGQCVVCASNENLEFDHIIPFSEGGANTYRNIQLLCQNCNRSKSNSIG